MKSPDLIKVSGGGNDNGGLYLLPGHTEIQAFDEWMTVAYKSPGNRDTMLVAFDRLCRLIEKDVRPDYILIDLDPGKGFANGHLICSADGLVLPCQADGPSYDAVKDALFWLRKYKLRYDDVYTRASEQFASTKSPMRKCSVKVLGTMMSKFTFAKGVDSVYIPANYAFWMRKIDKLIAAERPNLEAVNLAFPEEAYTNSGVHLQTMCLSRTHDWASLNGLIDKHGTPVGFLLADHAVERKSGKKLSGKHLEMWQKRVAAYRAILESASLRVMNLLSDDAAPLDVEMDEPVPDQRFSKTPGQQLHAKRKRDKEEAKAAAALAAQEEEEDSEEEI